MTFNPKIFEKYIPLFGMPTDMRVNKMLTDLYKLYYNQNSAAVHSLEHKIMSGEVPLEMQRNFFRNHEDPDKMDEQWITFFKNILHYQKLMPQKTKVFLKATKLSNKIKKISDKINNIEKDCADNAIKMEKYKKILTKDTTNAKLNANITHLEVLNALATGDISSVTSPVALTSDQLEYIQLQEYINKAKNLILAETNISEVITLLREIERVKLIILTPLGKADIETISFYVEDYLNCIIKDDKFKSDCANNNKKKDKLMTKQPRAATNIKNYFNDNIKMPPEWTDFINIIDIDGDDYNTQEQYIKIYNERKTLIKGLEDDIKNNPSLTFIKRMVNTFFELYNSNGEIMNPHNRGHLVNFSEVHGIIGKLPIFLATGGKKCKLDKYPEATIFKTTIPICFPPVKYEYKSFTHNLDKLATSIVKRNLTSAPDEVSSMLLDADEPNEQYHRDETNTLIENSTGKPVDTVNKFCETTLNKSVEKHACAKYLDDCLKGKNIKACKAYFDKPDFWLETKKEIDSMDPDVAYRTLKAFNFEKNERYDHHAKRPLMKVVTYAKWLEILNRLVSEKTLTLQEYNNISKNDKLRGYLEFIIEKVNASPAILNPDYKGASTEQIIDTPNFLKDTRFSTYGMERLPPRKITPSLPILRDAVRLRRVFGGILPMSMSVPMLAMLGGNPFEHLETGKYAYEPLEQEYASLLGRLLSVGKSISEPDNQTIIKLLEQLKNSEQKLRDVILTTEKYYKIITTQTEDPKTTIKLNHIKDFVNKRGALLQRVEKKQLNLIAIFDTITKSFISPSLVEYKTTNKLNSVDNTEPFVETDKTYPLN